MRVSFQDLGERMNDRLWAWRMKIRRLAVKLGLRKAPPKFISLGFADELSMQNAMRTETMPVIGSHLGIPIRMLPLDAWQAMNAARRQTHCAHCLRNGVVRALRDCPYLCEVGP